MPLMVIPVPRSRPDPGCALFGTGGAALRAEAAGKGSGGAAEGMVDKCLPKRAVVGF